MSIENAASHGKSPVSATVTGLLAQRALQGPGSTLAGPKRFGAIRGELALEVADGPGQEVIVETTTDLNAWTEAQRVTGQGHGAPVRITITPQAGVEARLWRMRRP